MQPSDDNKYLLSFDKAMFHAQRGKIAETMPAMIDSDNDYKYESLFEDMSLVP